jgi:anti-anti-sigma factor
MVDVAHPPGTQVVVIDVEADRTADTIVLAWAGELDVADAGALRSAIAAHPGKNIVVDLSGVTFIDATIVGVLVAARGRAAEGGLRLRVRNVGGMPRRVLELVHAYDLLAADEAP